MASSIEEPAHQEDEEEKALDPQDQQMDSNTQDTSKRIRKLTEKGQEQFSDNIKHYTSKLSVLWNKVVQKIKEVESCQSLNSTKLLQNEITLSYGQYRLESRRYLSFLEDARTEESFNELRRFVNIEQEYDETVHEVLKSLDVMIENLKQEERSLVSKSSRGSKSSSGLAQARIKAINAKIKMSLIKKEEELQKQKLNLENEMKCKQLNIESAIKAAQEQANYEQAEAEVLVYEDRDDFSVKVSLKDEPKATNDRVIDYVKSLPAPEVKQEPDEPDPSRLSLNPYAQEFVYREREPSIDLPTLMIRKDLLFSRLTKFDDNPEHYLVWKTTFQSVIMELNLNERDELDLLVKWLGGDSVKHAISIRASSATNPKIGLVKLWNRLDERFGSPEIIEAALRKKIERFPNLTYKDNKKLFDLVDILEEIENHMENAKYINLLSFYNSSLGVIPIVNKLPLGLQDKWANSAFKYKQENGVPFPPFTYFVKFIRQLSTQRNDPSFMFTTGNPSSNQKPQRKVSSLKTEVLTNDKSNQPDSLNKQTAPFDLKQQDKYCHMHNTYGHTLNSCRTFKQKPISIRKKFLKDKNICFKCCEKTNHRAAECKKEVLCDICGKTHATALHINFVNNPKLSPLSSHGGENQARQNYGGEHDDKQLGEAINTACIQVCGNENSRGKSCAKVVSVVIYSKTNPAHRVRAYALLDDQSNKTLVSPKFFDLFPGQFQEINYSLSSCAGKIDTIGRRADGFIVENLLGTRYHELPVLTECREIPDVREEIPSPVIVEAYTHLSDLVNCIPELDPQAPILLLIGRDLIEAHHVLNQRIGLRGQPFAQEYSLGWVIIGETCLGEVHVPDSIRVNKTYIDHNHRASIFPSCELRFTLKETGDDDDKHFKDIFIRTPEDDKQAMSVEDVEFINIMKNEMIKSPEGYWVAPLPFKESRVRLPNNREQAVTRACSLQRSLQKNPEKQKHFVEFMKNILDNGYAEMAPELQSNEECWYLPIFGVYHAKKGQIRVVFDSSAQYKGVSLNSVLLQGPDLMNSLLGVLMRFRRESVAIMADIQQMFFQFRVKEEHRNFLRFLWFRDNDPSQDMVEYRMCSHVFGNSPSPAIGSYGLLKTAVETEHNYGHDVRDLIHKDFYVDDALSSFESSLKAIDTISRTQKALKEGGNLRLHKIASNSKEVMQAFPKEDLAKDLQNVSIGEESLPMQRSLGLNWNLNTDSFTYSVSQEDKPLTRRGILSTVNSLYDPLGFVAPVVIQGKILMRDLIQDTVDWDQPLDEDRLTEWKIWKDSLTALENLSIPRMYVPIYSVNSKIHIFTDASEKAVSAVAYMTLDHNDSRKIGFVLGKSKVSPQNGHTIPRLELCAAVLGTEIAEIISKHLEISVDRMNFYTDSRVVLGYINNKTRRFYTYVQNRVFRILKTTEPKQWYYVPSSDNPADQGTRSLRSDKLQTSKWLRGPDFLQSGDQPTISESYDLQSPDSDSEIRPLYKCSKTVTSSVPNLGLDRFSSISRWDMLIRVIALLKNKIYTVKESVPRITRVELLKEAERCLIREVQRESFTCEIECLLSDQSLPRNSALKGLDPFMDEFGMLRVGGRLKRADELSLNEKHPLILPKTHFVTNLVCRYYHESVYHQGCSFTEGAIRSAGYWVIGVKRIVRSLISHCVKCKKLRGKTNIQIMSELPEDRVTPSAPFSYVGVDVFGPWNVVMRRTRGGSAQSKRWAVLYTCLATRAIHIEVIEELSTSSFINATRRFVSIRGPVKMFRSDRGTNFVGATDLMNIEAINVEDKHLKNFLENQRTVWAFNPPHSSHMGGIWERLIGVVRRILESLLAEFRGQLSHEVLTTFMAEVTNIVNSRPIVPVLPDSDNPSVLRPNLLLTQKPSVNDQYISDISLKDMYKAQWRRVQCLSNMFWKRWKVEFLQTLQKRRKWTDKHVNFKKGDIVLVKEDNFQRNFWPLGLITEVYPSQDGHVRKVQLKMTLKDDVGSKLYIRPITKLIQLIESDDKSRN